MKTNNQRRPMPISERAKQFAPFSPLRGLEKALAAKEKIRVSKKELSDEKSKEINSVLSELDFGNIVTVYYYSAEEGEYLQLTGMVARVDEYRRILQIVNTPICIDNIFDIRIEE